MSVASPPDPATAPPAATTEEPAPRLDDSARLHAPASLRTSHGVALAEVLAGGRVLVVFLRHAGCTFCREALADLRSQRRAFDAAGVVLVIVHQGTPEQGASLLRRYDLGDLHAISDPDRRLYRAFLLPRGTLRQLFGPRVWWRGFLATLRGHFVGRLVGDGFQMAGVFLLDRGRLVRAFRHASADDRPDYVALCRVDEA